MAILGGPAVFAEDYPAFRDWHETDWLEVKFWDQHTIRLREGALVDLNNQAMRAGSATREYLDALATNGANWVRLHGIAEDDLAALRQNGTARTGRPLADLNNWYRVHLADGASPPDVMRELWALPEVEHVAFVQKPLPLPLPPNYVGPSPAPGAIYQRYLDEAPGGIDARYAWGFDGGTGENVRVGDIEYLINENHLDFVGINFTSAEQNPDPTRFDDNHGTAVMGVMVGRDNSYGVRGIAFNAIDAHFAPSYTTGVVNIAKALTDLSGPMDEGDVILIEAQSAGPNFVNDGSQNGLVPVEWVFSTWSTINTMTANGFIIVEAGCNGAEDLDDAKYTTDNGGHYPFEVNGAGTRLKDSGAILVGAGAPSTSNNPVPRAPMNFSNYGGRLDVQGWGTDIVTLGYGTLYNSEGHNLKLARSFGGTSGATPIVGGAAALLQSIHKEANGGDVLTPSEMRQLLIDTGTPQEGTDKIGPLPNLRAAIPEMLGGVALDAPLITPGSGNYSEYPIDVTMSLPAGAPPGSTIRYTLDGSTPTVSSPLYSTDDVPVAASFRIQSPGTLKARAFAFDSVPGAIAEATYGFFIVVPPTVAPVTFAPDSPTTFETQLFVFLNTATDGADIWYTTDGSDPSPDNGTLYDSGLILNQTTRIRARGYKTGHFPSFAIADKTYTRVGGSSDPVPDPIIFPPGGNYASTVSVALFNEETGAQMYYTTNGTTPTTSSIPYHEPFNVTGSTTVRAIATASGRPNSGVSEETFTVVDTVVTPTISPNGGSFQGNQSVTLSTPTPFAVIRYTTNGAEPTNYSTAYTGPLTLTTGTTELRAKAFVNQSLSSGTAVATFNIFNPDAGTVANPEFRPLARDHWDNFIVEMTCDTQGATIHYTVGINEAPPNPTTASTVYNPSNPPFISVNNSYFFRAIAVKSGQNNSSVVPKTYILDDPLPGSSIAAPTIDPEGGVFNNSVTVDLNAVITPAGAQSGLRLYYTFDGSEPTVPDPPGTTDDTPTLPNSLGPNGEQRLRVIGYRDFIGSGPESEATFTFVVADPEISPTEQTHVGSVSVEMSTITTSAQVRYTINGADPTSSDDRYQDPIVLGPGEYVIRARGFRNKFADSEVVTRTFVVEETPVAPSFTSTPVNDTVTQGSDVTAIGVADGFPEPSYQWSKDGQTLVGQTSNAIYLPAVRPEDAGLYTLTATNSAGSDTTSFTLTIEAPPITSGALVR